MVVAVVMLFAVAAISCSPRLPLLEESLPTPTRETIRVRVIADGTSEQFLTASETVEQALEEAGFTLNPSDEVRPPRNSPLPHGLQSTEEEITITIVRVTETVELIPESIPYKRRIIRSADLPPEDSPKILQTGSAGLREVNMRIVFRDGLEAERWPISVDIVEPPQDEIIMIAVSSRRDAMSFRGRMAYVDDGRAIVLDGSTDFPRQLPIDARLDGRVFQLSPDGRYLLYSAAGEGAEPESFGNELWVVETTGEAVPRSLRVENVLWAGWDPSAVAVPRIAYSTARAVSLPPGWEANNDLWLLELSPDGSQTTPIRLVESYAPATAWWGGNYAWSPSGHRLAYAYADEVGLLDMPEQSPVDGAQSPPAPPSRTVLHTFQPYETGADWAWIPVLSWSSDGRYLAFSEHRVVEDDREQFNILLADTISGASVEFAGDAGIWSAVEWSPESSSDARLATLLAVEPGLGEESAYRLWLADGDGSNATQVFPPDGETGRFGRSYQSLSWGPDSEQLAFIFDGALTILELSTGESYTSAADDTVSSHLTWAPYGAAVGP